MKKLIGLVKATRKPDRTLDARIWWYLRPDDAARVYREYCPVGRVPKSYPRGTLGRRALETFAPSYTSSIDAGAGEVPDGWRLIALYWPHEGPAEAVLATHDQARTITGGGYSWATPATALIEAVLRADAAL